MLHKDICDISPFNKYGSFTFHLLEATANDVPNSKLNMFRESGTQRYVCGVFFPHNVLSHVALNWVPIESLSGSVVVISRRACCRVHVGCGWVHVGVVTVASNAR